MGQTQTDQQQAEAQLYAHTAQVLSVHDLLLSDEVRNKAFFEALRQCVTSESAVLDIGSGTGIWAVIAAKLGARKVVAIERDQLLIGLIRRMAHDNGVADRVTVVNADSRQAQLEREFDVVVSETIGNVIFEEDIVPVMADARARFLTPAGHLIPSAVTLVVAPAYFPRPAHLPSGISADFDYFDRLRLNSPVALTNTPIALNNKTSLRVTGDSRALIDVDLTTSNGVLDLTNLCARWESMDMTDVNCFAVWAQLKLTGSLSISTMDTSSWSTMMYPIRSFEDGQGDLEFRLALTSITNHWSVSLATNGQNKVQSYSPAKAATELLVLARTDQNVLSHLERMDLLDHTLKRADVDSR